MPESGSSGSVRGVSRNGHPYRDPREKAAIHRSATLMYPCITEPTERIRCSRSIALRIDWR
jgi:hypothetical protein